MGLLMVAAGADAGDIADGIRLTAGDYDDRRNHGTVLIMPRGRVIGAEEVFPAISSDRKEVAIFRSHASSKVQPAAIIEIFDRNSHQTLERFVIQAPNESGVVNGQPSEEAMQLRLDRANDYLSKSGFRGMKQLYGLSADNRSRVEQFEHSGMRIRYDHATGELVISARDGVRPDLRIRQPTLVSGPPRGSFGPVGYIRGVPERAWVDADVELLIIHFEYRGGSHYEDYAYPDKWSIVELR